MTKERIKFTGRVNKRMPQFFPKNNLSFDYGEYAVLNFDVLEELEGDVYDSINNYGNITIGGYCLPPDYSFDKDYTVMAELKEINKYGKQWVGLMCNHNINLNDTWQQKTFMKSFLSDSQIQSLFEACDNPLKMIEEGNRQELEKAKGVGIVMVEKIIERYEKNKDYAEAIVELVEYGMTPDLIIKLSDRYGSANILVSKIKSNPYILVNEIKGMGFKKVDNMALESGLPRLSMQRLKAYIKYILNEAGMSGYSWIDSETLIDKIEIELDIFPMEDIVSCIIQLKEKNIIWNGVKGKVALQKYYKLEEDISLELLRIMEGNHKFDFVGWEGRVRQTEIMQGWNFTDEQQQAIKDIMSNQINILTGLGGSGKTNTLLGSLKALDERVTFAQCALSGKASARMEEATGLKASTIHRLLGYNPSNMTKDNPSVFAYNEKKQLNVEIVALDEFPMIGGSLFLSLLKAIPTGCKLALIGDDFQLPAIGSLNIGKDLINCKTINTSKLTIIHRQSEKSAIRTESYKVAMGEQIVEKDWYGIEVRGELKDLKIDIYKESWETSLKVIEHFKERLRDSGNDIMEVQIISPMNLSGKSSVYALNNLAQEIYNPSSEDKAESYLSLSKDKGYTLRVGDKIINTVNNYEMSLAVEEDESGVWINQTTIGVDDCECDAFEPVFNGYMGTIMAIQNNDLIINIPLLKKDFIVSKGHWQTQKGIQLAYAVTCHKMQGSECKYTIIALDSSHFVMHSKEWLYTALSRAKLHCTLVAENQALRNSISTTAVQEKQTFLMKILDKEEI